MIEPQNRGGSWPLFCYQHGRACSSALIRVYVNKTGDSRHSAVGYRRLCKHPSFFVRQTQSDICAIRKCTQRGFPESGSQMWMLRAMNHLNSWRFHTGSTPVTHLPFSSPWRGKRRVFERCKPAFMDQLQPSTNSDKLSDCRSLAKACFSSCRTRSRLMPRTSPMSWRLCGSYASRP
jgi:hypothetical protein